jgi:dodecin
VVLGNGQDTPGTWRCGLCCSFTVSLPARKNVVLAKVVRYGDEAAAERCSLRAVISREVQMAVASVSKITAASAESFDAAVREGLERASKTLRNITGLHVLEHKASVDGGKIAEYRVTMEVTFILET